MNSDPPTTPQPPLLRGNVKGDHKGGTKGDLQVPMNHSVIAITHLQSILS
ncbi:hypothetical protein CWATWH0401_3047 [Crocosphaera watsonii WH 0401]|uniref:Uncharacterized protein n=1 Tax=Crocosphaera watsonii WH 0401 TaxID=555881 RepID=T2JB00_CROWT|nr:hypothetical protein CWATWH0401_3047 [Crocosphaera watsonii WH 0401]